MLHELRIRNFAIIDDLHLTFGPGLNVLTGETGAGKSIIIDALGLLLGDRAAAEWVRSGSERAEIEATFHLPVDDSGTLSMVSVQRRLIEEGLDDPDGPDWVMLSREVRLSGRNVCRINGRAVTLQILSDIASQLIDVHGQGEHLNLLQARTHIHLLDRYAGLLAERQKIATQVAKLRSVRSELQRLRQDARTIAQRADILSYQVEEIRDAQLQPGQDVLLENERRRLGNAETLMNLAQSVQIILGEGSSEGIPSAVDLVSEAVGQLERLARVDPEMEQTADDGQGLLEQLSDLGRTVQDYADALEFNPERLEEVEDEIELINNLKRKYGETIEQIIAFGEAAQNELDELGNWEVKTAELEEQEEALSHQIGKLGQKLSEKRQKAGKTIARKVEAELADLKMNRARFGVAVVQSPQESGAYLADGQRVAFDATGIDKVEFLMSANPGEPLKPMTKVASGGETARLMLALKGVLAHADATPTLIFDEIDQGIGGRVGAIVGQKLWGLTGYDVKKSTNTSMLHQVLCITHLPQLAAFGDQHFTVNKRVSSDNGEERTSTVVRQLEGDIRVHELMQMLGATTEAGRRSVEEMLDEVTTLKRRD